MNDLELENLKSARVALDSRTPDDAKDLKIARFKLPDASGDKNSAAKEMDLSL